MNANGNIGETMSIDGFMKAREGAGYVTYEYGCTYAAALAITTAHALSR